MQPKSGAAVGRHRAQGGQPVWSNSANLVLPQFPCLAELAAQCVWLPRRKAGTAAAHVLALAGVCSYKG